MLLLLLLLLLRVRPLVLSKTLSQIWDRLNLPILLFKVGLLTLMKMDSFMFLARLCPSLPIIWKLFLLVGCPVCMLWWWIAEGAFRCSLYLSPKGPGGFPYVLFITALGPHIGTCRWHHFG